MIRAPLGWLGRGRLVSDVRVVVDGPTVVSAGPASSSEWPGVEAEVSIDGFLMPGIADRHVHVGLSSPGAILAGGVTAVRDLGWPPDAIEGLVAASDGAAFDGPRIRAVGPMITARGGYPIGAGWAPAGTGIEVVGAAEASEVAERVAVRTSAGAVKVALNADAGPVLRDDELVAVCEAAHRSGAAVTVHAQGRGQAERALGAGADEFAHCPWSERLADDMVRAMAGRMRIVSTLDIHSYGVETPELTVARDNMRRFSEAGGRIAYGTDLGNGPIPPGIHAGEASHLAAAGLATDAILGAMAFRQIAAGAPADLVALRGNPFDDLHELDDVVFVMRGGRRVR